MNVLVACEESQRVCIEFRKLGHNAFSCDILECSGGHPEWHFKQDCLEVIKNKGGILETGECAYVDGWDLMIAHPPCTYLCVSGASWYYHPEDKHLPVEQRRPHPRYPTRRQDQAKATEFFMSIINADVPRIAVENPVGVMSRIYRKPDQIIQPYYFGDSVRKTTCLWLKNLPNLKPTNIVDKGEMVVYKNGKTDTKWHCETRSLKNRSTVRSKTFPGIAKAMAEQWGGDNENDRPSGCI